MFCNLQKATTFWGQSYFILSIIKTLDSYMSYIHTNGSNEITIGNQLNVYY
jgi:hypothetical protein